MMTRLLPLLCLLAGCTTLDTETPVGVRVNVVIVQDQDASSWVCEDDGGPWYVEHDGGVYPVVCGDAGDGG